MPKLPRASSAVVLRALKRIGFYEVRQIGSHVQLRHSVQVGLRVTVPIHSWDVPTKTLKYILAQADLTVEQFIELL